MRKISRLTFLVIAFRLPGQRCIELQLQGSMERIYVSDDGDVEMLAPSLPGSQANNEVKSSKRGWKNGRVA